MFSYSYGNLISYRLRDFPIIMVLIIILYEMLAHDYLYSYHQLASKYPIGRFYARDVTEPSETLKLS